MLVRPPHSGVVAPSTPGGRPAIWAATGRSGGFSEGPFASMNLALHVGDHAEAVRANREALCVRVKATGLAVLSAVHGADVAVVDQPGEAVGVDAVITRTPGLGVVALGADCVTVAVIGDDDLTVAAVHCGWQGLVLGVLPAAIARMADMGVAPVQIILGPSICGSCYPVPLDRVDHVSSSCSDQVARSSLVECPDGQPGIDVREGLRAQVIEFGVSADLVLSVGGCTFEDPELFSYRRDGRTGRHGMVVVRSE